MSRRIGILIAIVVAAGMVTLGVIVWLQVRAGISAHDEPTYLETMIARTMRSLAIPADAKSLVNPLERNDDLLASARAHWADHCASCHGNDGRGDTPMGRGMFPKAPDMSAAGTQDLSDGELAYIIRNGIRLTGMPGWGEAGTPPSDADWELVHFIRHLPQITPEELEQMKAMNPISAHDMEERRMIEAFLAGEDVDTAGHDARAGHGDPGHHH
jgi:mono/diheme cytochrome c family protein